MHVPPLTRWREMRVLPPSRWREMQLAARRCLCLMSRLLLAIFFRAPSSEQPRPLSLFRATSSSHLLP